MVRHYDSSGAGVEWDTPKYIWEPIANAVGGFDLGPASGAEDESNKKADVLYDEEDDGLSKEWFGDVWINPPYGRSENPLWGEKVFSESKNPNVDSITALVPASTSTNWWQENYAHADLLCFIDHRVSFSGTDQKASFASVICYFGPVNEDYLNAVSDLGLTVRNGETKPTEQLR